MKKCLLNIVLMSGIKKQKNDSRCILTYNCQYSAALHPNIGKIKVGKHTGYDQMKKMFMELLDQGKFHDAKKVWYGIPVEKQLDFLKNLVAETNSLGIYTFVVHLLLEEETSDLHSKAESLLQLSMWEGAYTSALSHARRAAALSPHDLTYKEELLFYVGMPDCSFAKDEAVAIAKEVLARKPSSTMALDILEWATGYNRSSS